jgi:hypothetical protein
MVLHMDALGGVPKGVTAKTVIERADGLNVYVVFSKLSSAAWAEVILEGGKTKKVRAGAITPQRVADAETDARCRPFVASPPEVERQAPAGATQKRARQGGLPAVVDGPDNSGPKQAYRIPVYNLSTYVQTDHLVPDVLPTRDNPIGKHFVAFSDPPLHGGVVLRFQDQQILVPWAVAERFVVSDPEEAKALMAQFYPKLGIAEEMRVAQPRPAAPPIVAASWPTAAGQARGASVGMAPALGRALVRSVSAPPGARLPSMAQSPFQFRMGVPICTAKRRIRRRQSCELGAHADTQCDHDAEERNQRVATAANDVDDGDVRVCALSLRATAARRLAPPG